MPVSELNGYSTRRLLTVLLISHRNLAISRRTTNLAIDSMNVWVRDDADGDDATTHIDCTLRNVLDLVANDSVNDDDDAKDDDDDDDDDNDGDDDDSVASDFVDDEDDDNDDDSKTRQLCDFKA